MRILGYLIDFIEVGAVQGEFNRQFFGNMDKGLRDLANLCKETKGKGRA